MIGDVVRAKAMKIKKSYGFARLMEVLEPSVSRVIPSCPVARQCGGCQLQAMSYEEQLKFKAVSYTHLDVYKRQAQESRSHPGIRRFPFRPRLRHDVRRPWLWLPRSGESLSLIHI